LLARARVIACILHITYSMWQKTSHPMYAEIGRLSADCWPDLRFQIDSPKPKIRIFLPLQNTECIFQRRRLLDLRRMYVERTAPPAPAQAPSTPRAPEMGGLCFGRGIMQRVLWCIIVSRYYVDS